MRTNWLLPLTGLAATLAAALPAPASPALLVPRAGTTPSLSGPFATMGPGTYPRANHLSDGSLIGAYTATVDGNKVITLARSTNNGANWTEIGTAASGSTTTKDVDNPFPIQLPSGRLLVAFRNHDGTDPNWTYYRLTICYSDDEGKTWEYLSTPVETGVQDQGVWEPFMRLTPDNTLQFYYSKLNNNSDQDSLLRESTDGGVTWSDPAVVLSGAELSSNRDGMLGVAPTSADGANGDGLIAVFETEKDFGTFHIESVTSPDGGKTWGNRRVVYQPADTASNAQAPQVVNVGGTLVASFMTDEDTPGSVDLSIKTAKLVTSSDGGATWDNKITFGEASSLWPGLLTLDATSLLAMADHGGAKAQKVVLS